ncbi:MBL fold metallo-hydrolase [Pyrococcus yayanosii]|uniref:Hydrolase n=1 Tax=Pyrococcus yayanosii (strain CH1 / JCM 16557) TaxID=529709 RepID=F8AE93_PYRYC|nr:MBL fold metallo-hydrolase [Pyrococcus yayanosii]AEH24604.1 hydrolase [Pyrococcus yayanosii CH1]
MIPVEIPPHTLLLRGVGLDSNVYAIRDGDELLIIDTGTGVYWNRYLSALAGEGYLEGVKRAVIFNTHEHFDHVGGNLAFRRALEERGIEVEFAAHEFTAEALEKGDDYLILSFYYGRRVEPHTVNIKLRDGDELSVGSLRLRVLHTPGHTRGSACLYEPEEGLLFTGDTVFAGTYGRTDLPTGDINQLRASLRRLAELDVHLGLPGHGRVIGDWKRNLEKLLRVIG